MTLGGKELEMNGNVPPKILWKIDQLAFDFAPRGC